MPEAIAVLVVLLLAVGIFLVGKHHPTTRGPQTKLEERDLIVRRLSWLQDRLERGRAECWDAATLHPLQRESEELQEQLRALGHPPSS